MKIFLVLGFLFCLSATVSYGTTIDHYISTGDNHFVTTWLPVESPNSIRASFDLLKDVWGVRRIHWRGLQEAQYSSSGPTPMLIRDGAHPRLVSFWNWLNYLVNDVNIAQVPQ